jgi:hypothetical protein
LKRQHKEAQWAEPVSLTFHSVLRKLNTEPFIGASYQISINLAIEMVLEKIYFRNRPTRNKNCLWWPCLLKDRNKMNNFNRGSSTDDFYQVSFQLANWIQRSMAKHFQRRRLKCEKLTDDGHL